MLGLSTAMNITFVVAFAHQKLLLPIFIFETRERERKRQKVANIPWHDEQTFIYYIAFDGCCFSVVLLLVSFVAAFGETFPVLMCLCIVYARGNSSQNGNDAKYSIGFYKKSLYFPFLFQNLME